jgi:tetratricopeptide (TPR) repeat protein
MKSLLYVCLCCLSLAAHAEIPSADLIKQAENGDAKAAIKLGHLYRNGDEIEQDYAKALRWYRLAADQGDAEGLDNVGYMHLRGWGTEKNEVISAAFFKASGDKGHAQGLFNLGNAYFSGQGVTQNYDEAVAAWQKASDLGHTRSTWRLAVLYAAGEHVKQDRMKAMQLCSVLADKGDDDAMLLLGELLYLSGKKKEAREWWEKSEAEDKKLGTALLTLSEWRDIPSVPGQHAYIEMNHLYQGWNNCGATSMAMLARHAGISPTPYDIKRLCPRKPIGTGTDWADLVESCKALEVDWEMVTFTHDQTGFEEGADFLREQLDSGNPVVIDFTVSRMRDGQEHFFGHTLTVVGYHKEKDQWVLKNPNRPSPGIQIMSSEELEKSWRSTGYSRLAKGQSARPLIVLTE